MTDKIKCFMIHPTEWVDVFNRRYSFRDDGHQLLCACRCTHSGLGYHNAMTFRERRAAVWGEHDGDRYLDDVGEPDIYEEGWNLVCACGYQFHVHDYYQLHQELVYQDDQGREYHLNKLPPGAMYSAWWLANNKRYTGPDGLALFVMTPGGIWCIDGRASNCGSPDDDQHKCWVRHGDPPQITVDKKGNTCSAGAGSIGVGNYHGFLRDGYLVLL